MEASYEGGQGPEGAVAPYMHGWMDHHDTETITNVTVSNVSLFLRFVHLICPEYHSTSHNQNTITNFFEHFWPAHPHCADQYTKITWL